MKKRKPVKSLSRSRMWLMAMFRAFILIVFAGFLAGLVGIARPAAQARIREGHWREMKLAFRHVLPPFDNEPWSDTFVLHEQDIFPAYQYAGSERGRSFCGIALKLPVPGFTETNKVLIGINPQGKITGARIVHEKHFSNKKEIQKQEDFLKALEGLSESELILTESQKQSLQDQSPPVFSEDLLNAVSAGLVFFRNNQEEIFRKTGFMPAPVIPPPLVLPEIPEQEVARASQT